MNTSVPSLVTIENNVPLADSRQIALNLEIEHHNFYALIKKYEKEIAEDFGKVLFDSEPLPSGQKQFFALLTEEQSYVYLAYSQNTPQARACKRKLVKAFMEAQKLLAHIAPQPAPLYLDADYAAQLQHEGLTPRCIRMVSIMTMLSDLYDLTENQNPLRSYLWQQWRAEADAMTPEDDLWGNPPQLTPKRPQRRLKR